MTGQLIGTPSYMSPEQAAAQRGTVGRASDIYALGAILYALLTGRPPHRGSSALETVRQVTVETPVEPRVLNAAVPADLETICLKCLEKAPESRYATAQDLAHDLARFLAGEPIRAQRVGLITRAGRWAHRHPTFTLAAVTIALAALLASLSLSLHTRQVEEVNAHLQRSLRDRDASLAVAQRNELWARNSLYVSDMQLVEPYAAEGDLRSSNELLDNNVPPPGKIDLRGFEWWVLKQRQSRISRTLIESRTAFYCVDISPSGTLMAAGGRDAVLRLCTLNGPRVNHMRELPTHHQEINGVAFSSDGRKLATVGDDGWVCLWDPAAGQLLNEFRAHEKEAYQARFLRQDSVLLTCGQDSALRLWDCDNRSATR